MPMGSSADLSTASDLPDPPDFSERAVHGTVLDASGMPASGVRVAIGAAQTTTDTTGSFTLAAPSGSYDVLVAARWGTSSPLVTQYLGLTRDDPTLRLGASLDSMPGHTAHLSGTFTGIPTPTPGMTSYIATELDATHTWVDGYVTQPIPLAFAGLEVDWAGPAQQTSLLRALYYRQMGDLRTVVGYGEAPFTVTEGLSTVLANPVPLSTPATATLSATIGSSATPPFYFHTYLDVGFTHAPLSAGSIPAGGTLSVVEPVIAGSTIMLTILGRSAGKACEVSIHGLQPDASVGAITPSAAGDVDSIAGAPAAVDRDTQVSYVGAGSIGDLHVFTWRALTDGRWQVVTATSSARFPAATALGVANPTPADPVDVNIAEFAIGAVDAAAGIDDFANAKTAVAPGVPFRTCSATSPSFSFAN
jgi:hypothetical protein